MKKILYLLLILINLSFAFQIVPINTNQNNLKNNKQFNNNIENNIINTSINNNIKNNLNKNIYSNFNKNKNSNNNNNNLFYKNFVFDGKTPITIYLDYLNPTIIRFPAFIEKIEYIEGKGGIFINQNGFMKGSQSLTILKKNKTNIDNILYVTVLGVRIPFILKYYKYNNTKPYYLVNISLKTNLLKNKLVSNRSGSFSTTPKVIKITKYKNLSFNTNIKAVNMIIRMIKGTADDYFTRINLYLHKNDNFFRTKNLTKEKYLALLFKKVFAGNKYFITTFLNNEIEPVGLWEDNYYVYLSNKNKKLLKIYGMKTKWCNLSKNYFKQITIDDIKLVFGRNILAAYHPFRKIAPGQCVYVYTVFYYLNKKIY